MDDRGIIELFWVRDESAIGETDAAYGAYCRRMAMDLLGSREDAEECVNDAYAALWNRIPTDRPERFRAYLGRILRNICVNMYRYRRAARRDSGITVSLEELADCVPSLEDPQRRLEDRELGEAISRWLDGLDRDARALFLRRYWYGESLKDLAGLWGVPANRLAQRLRSLRLSLRRALEKEDIEI